jgi:signal transduction histidine kinase
MLSRLREVGQERDKLAEQVRRLNEELSDKVAKGNRELREKNQELQNLNEELYYLQKRLTSVERLTVAQQTTARLAHKIGTPLNLISGHIQVLQQSRPEDSALQEKLQIVHSQIEKVSGIVREMLDETRKPVLDLKPLDLNQLLDRILAVVEPTLAAREIKVDKRFTLDLDHIEGDEVQLEQVFLSLVHNSLDAMNQGGTFGDTGEGIPPTIVGHIFRPFFTTKEIGRGTGLGLAIVKEILTAHGATINVESVPTLGTTFTLDFPQASTREAIGAER